MIITAIAYANVEQTSLKVTTSDQGVMTITYLQPGDSNRTWHHGEIDKWLAVQGNAVTAFVDPVDYMAKMRSQRDTLLAVCDWTGLVDAALTPEEKAAWASYRQALRDMPQNNPITTKVQYDALTWPTKP